MLAALCCCSTKWWQCWRMVFLIIIATTCCDIVNCDHGSFNIIGQSSRSVNQLGRLQPTGFLCARARLHHKSKKLHPRSLDRKKNAITRHGSAVDITLNGDDDPDKRTENSSRGQKLILPVFPLRKAVKLPSEMLTLNLYEERYLALAECVLQGKCFLGGESQIASSSLKQYYFGALYCSNKPQMVRNGVGPIVPIVEEGDIGVICKVVHYEEGMVPIKASPSEARRRIKLVAIAVGRFSINEVLHNGYDDGGVVACCEGGGEFEKLPYIVVEASVVNDVPDEERKSEKEKQLMDLERELYRKVLKAESQSGGELDVAGAWKEEVPFQEFAPFFPTEIYKTDGQTHMPNISQREQVAGTTEIIKALLEWEGIVCESECNVDQCTQSQRRQFFSFVAAQKLIRATMPTTDMLNLLE